MCSCALSSQSRRIPDAQRLPAPSSAKPHICMRWRESMVLRELCRRPDACVWNSIPGPLRAGAHIPQPSVDCVSLLSGQVRDIRQSVVQYRIVELVNRYLPWNLELIPSTMSRHSKHHAIVEFGSPWRAGFFQTRPVGSTVVNRIEHTSVFGSPFLNRTAISSANSLLTTSSASRSSSQSCRQASSPTLLWW